MSIKGLVRLGKLGVANIHQGCKSLNPYMKKVYNNNNLQVGYRSSGLRGSVCLVYSLYLYPRRCYSDSSNLVTQSEQVCIEKKAEIYKKGFPAIFKDMSKMKDKFYLASTKDRLRHLTLFSLKNVPGIYMITNNTTKKFYIGMSINLQSRFNDYLDINKLNLNKSSRISKALLKYGFEKFSITILELPKIAGTEEKYRNINSLFFNIKGKNEKSDYLRKREDFYIKVFKPQYNIKRYIATRDADFVKHKCKVCWEIPVQIKSLLNRCLDPKSLDYNLAQFAFNKKTRSYRFVATTPKGAIEANSSAWYEGKIQNAEGLKLHKNAKAGLGSIILFYDGIDKDKLAEFYPEKGLKFVKECLKIKKKTLYAKFKKEHNITKTVVFNYKER